MFAQDQQSPQEDLRIYGPRREGIMHVVATGKASDKARPR